MDLTAKCKLIDGLVREDQEATIADYLDVMKEIETIEQSLKPTTETWQKSSHYRGHFPPATQKQGSPHIS